MPNFETTTANGGRVVFRPARSTVAVKQLPRNVPVEIEAVAEL
jgi:enamine deaminase RidA (YjgF/YER057c/UK114 family)